MKKQTFATTLLALSVATSAFAGGILTNTNQNIAFNRMMSRDGSIGIDGVYSNPAGVVFLSDGSHLSLNLQTAQQTRTICNSYPLFAGNTNNQDTERRYKGTAFSPVIPSIMYAYNWKGFSFQGHFGITGGGGKCTFDDGLGSFEKIVSETALGVCNLAGAIDNMASVYGVNTGLTEKFGKTGAYSYDSYMRGRQYYFGLSLGAAYKITPHFSAFAGVRGVYATSNYYGYVKDIKVGSVPLYTMLDPTKSNAADIEMNCDQSGIGFTPILGIDYKTGRWNFGVKYEFKTRIRLKTESVNRTPSIGNLPDNLINMGIPAAIVGSETVSGALLSLKTQFDSKLNQALGEFEDGQKIADDLPAILTVGVSYNPIDPLRVNAGFHYFFDKQASQYNHKEDLLKHGTAEYNAGVEYDACKLVTVSAGWQSTNYGLTKEYMDDKSFVTSSNSVGVGVALHLSKKTTLNAAYFHTFYKHFNASEDVQLNQNTTIQYNSDFTRNNNVFGIGLDIDF